MRPCTIATSLALASTVALASAAEPYPCPAGWQLAVAENYGQVGTKCYRQMTGQMNMMDCEARCKAERKDSSMLCISTLEENQAIYGAFVEPGHCENGDVSSCVWLGLTNGASARS